MWCGLMYKWYKRLVYAHPVLLARFCKVNLSNAKNSAWFLFQAWLIYGDQEPLWLIKCDRRWLLFYGCTYEAINSMQDLVHSWAVCKLFFSKITYASVNSTCAQPPPPRATEGHLHASSVPGVRHLQILHCLGPGIRQPRGHSRGFDTHPVLKRVVKACYWFYPCVSLLLIKPELHSEIGAIDVNQRFLVIESNFCSYYLKNILSHL